MEAVSVGSGYAGGVGAGTGGGHYGTYGHYGAAYPAQPAYLVEPQVPAYMAQVSCILCSIKLNLCQQRAHQYQ